MPERILVHCCCGPCATSSIQRLLDEDYLPVLYYRNSNIFPEEENIRRYENLKKVASHFNLELIRDSYAHDNWLEFIRGLENEPEHGKRCLKCFEYNLKEACIKAKELGIGKFCTTLTVSRFKNSNSIFSVGEKFEGFLPIDFKKKDGFAKSCRMAEEMGLYRQKYCGCEFSKKVMEDD